MARRSHSFGIRLAAAFAGVGIAAAALTAILVNVTFGQRFSGYLGEQQTAGQRELVAALAASYRRTDGWDVADLTNLTALALMNGGIVTLQDAGGRTIWQPAATRFGQGMLAMHESMMGTGPLGPTSAIPVVVDGRRVGTVVFRLPQAGLLPHDRAFRSQVNRLLLAGGVIAGLVALLLGALLARRATAPARELTRAARALREGERSRRVPAESADEFGEMAEAFNAMAEEIEREDRLRTEFAASVAHELRTPLAILRSEVEAMQDGIATADAGTLASLHEEVLRVGRLVEDLQTLSSAEAAGFSLERRPVALRTLVEDAVREFSGPFQGEGIALHAAAAEVTTVGDATRLHQVVANLLSNALKFTPSGGRVELELRPQDGWAVLSVRDTGVGIPPEEVPHVFDRFFRGADARASGSGIGLTVVRDLVEAHGGAVEIESVPGRGTVVTIRLPEASPPESPGPFTSPSHAPPTVSSTRSEERADAGG